MDKPNEGRKAFAHTHGSPPRVAPRLEGKVRNVGIKPKRKKKQRQKVAKKKARSSGKVVR